MANTIRDPDTAAVADETQPDAAPSAATEPHPKSDSPSFIARFTVLKSASRELWITFALKFFAILSWSLMNRTIVFWLQSDLGYGDETAGSIVATWSAVMTLVTVLAGSFTDAVGLRRTFLLGAGVCMAARLMMATTVHPLLALGLGMLPVAVGEALLSPVMVAATKRYATTAQRSISFSIVYAIMNLAFLVSAKTFDYMRRNLGEHGHHNVLGLDVTTYEALFFLSIAVMAPVFLLALALRDNIEVTDHGIRILNGQNPTPPPTPAPQQQTQDPDPGAVLSYETKRKPEPPAPLQPSGNALLDTFRIFRGLWTQPGFVRFLVFLLFATFMRMIFFHTSYTLAPMGVRELGDGAPVGALDAINNILILILVPLVGALTQRVSAYKMVVFGSSLGAASVFIMAVPVHFYQPLADGWPGRAIAWYCGLSGPVNPWYVSIALFYVAISFGEAFYSPRLYEYAAVIAPSGQEASYMSLSYLPFFGAKLTVGLLSGFLLANFCPKVGPRHSEMIWLIIALLTLIAPVGLIIFRKYIQAQEAGRD